MARLLKSPIFGLSVNLDGNVGPRGGNERSDVGVVQYALLLLSSGAQTPFGGTGGSLNVPGQGTIAVDGFFGSQTAAFISAYQAKRVKLPGPSLTSLPRPDGNFGNSRNTAWNFGLLKSDVEGTVGDFLEKLRVDTRAPAFLKAAFFT